MGKIIGLTGGIASGKSTVTQLLRELGAEIYDADEVAKLIVEPGKPAWHELVKEFGENILNSDQTINRAKLGQIVFTSSKARTKLNEITHPRIGEMFREAIAEFKGKKSHSPVLILDIPLLIETKMDNLVDEIWLVYVQPETQVKRLMKRNSLNREEALARLAAQMPIDEKKQHADVIIDNQGPIEETRQIVIKLWKEQQD